MFQDFRYGLRMLAKSPGFSMAVVLTLALGIGANTAIFTIVNSVLLRPLPFPNPSRLYMLLSAPRNLAADLRFGTMSDPEFLEYRNRNRSFEALAAFSGTAFTLTGLNRPLRVDSCQVTSDFFTVLGVTPVLGRAFLPEEYEAGRNAVALLSDRFWRKEFASDSSVIGKTIELDGVSHTVVGVMPPGFAFPAADELWVPASLEPANHSLSFRRVVGRLRPGIAMEQAQTEMNTIAQRVALEFKEFKGKYDNKTARVVSLHQFVVGDVRLSLIIFLGAVSFVLLIACVNVANLLLARASSRTQEIAIRASLGAGKVRLIRQLVTESTLLSLCGGAAGLLLSMWGVSALISFAPPGRLPRASEIGLDPSVFGLTLLMSLLTGLFFGVAPARQVFRAGWTRLGGARSFGGRHRLRDALVVVEVALALVLLAGAGLMIKSFHRLRSVDTGFRPENVLTMSVDLPENLYSSAGRIKVFHREVLERIARLPGVVAMGTVNWLPLGNAWIHGDFQIEGRPQPGFSVSKPAVSSGYFRAMGIRLLRGREFDDRDGENSSQVAIVGEELARRLWPGENPLGKRISLEDSPKPQDWLTIAGVVEDVKQENLAAEAPPAIYRPVSQVVEPFWLAHTVFVVRTVSSPAAIAPALRSALWEVDKNQPVQTMATMEDLIDSSTSGQRFQTQILASFSLLALVLGIVGIYGVIACSVTQQTHEIGVRMALGARERDVLKMVLEGSMILILGGIVLGLAGAAALTRLLSNFLFEVKPVDPETFAAASILLAAAGLLASYFPARRATKVDPLIALRYE